MINNMEKCPKCGADKTIPIVYGFPANELFEAAERGEACLGGCIIEEDPPSWYCKLCKNKWGGK